MATLLDIQNLSMGNRSFQTATGVNTNQQAVVLTNGVTGAGECLSCEDAVCEVTPTQAVAFDNGSLKSSSGTKIQFTVVGGTVDTHIDLFSNFRFGDEASYAVVWPSVGIITPNAFANAGVLVNGFPNAHPISLLNAHLAGGSVATSLKIKFNSTVESNADIVVKTFHFRVRPEESPIITSVYEPFCDFCVSNSNGDFVTHLYTLNAPVTFRDGIDILVPALSTFTVEVCYAIINLPNTLAAPAQLQMA